MDDNNCTTNNFNVPSDNVNKVESKALTFDNLRRSIENYTPITKDGVEKYLHSRTVILVNGLFFTLSAILFIIAMVWAPSIVENVKLSRQLHSMSNHFQECVEGHDEARALADQERSEKYQCFTNLSFTTTQLEKKGLEILALNNTIEILKERQADLKNEISDLRTSLEMKSRYVDELHAILEGKTKTVPSAFSGTVILQPSLCGLKLICLFATITRFIR